MLRYEVSDLDSKPDSFLGKDIKKSVSGKSQTLGTATTFTHQLHGTGLSFTLEIPTLDDIYE